MSIEDIRRRVYELDGLIEVLRLASLQIEQNQFADVLARAQKTNWEVHEFLEEFTSGNKVRALAIVPKDQN